MTDILNDKISLQILENICQGKAVSVNYSYLSRKLNKHRGTIRKRVNELIEKKIINPPVFPFFGQYREHPLLIMVQADIPSGKKFDDWIRKDSHIFAAYKLKRGEYNTLLIMFHRNILRYQLWRRSIVREGKIPSRSERYPSSASFFSTQMMIKYEPSASVNLLEQVFNKRGYVNLNNHKLDRLSLDILKCLTQGKGIRLNEDMLSKFIKVNRKTIKRRISKLLDDKMILDPVCRFPSFFGPEDSVLVISFVEIKRNEKKFVEHIKQDPHITFAFQVCSGRYNYLLFEVFERVADHIKWEHELNKSFGKHLGICDAIYLTPNMTLTMDQQKVSLAVIKKRLSLLKNPEVKTKWDPFIKEI